MRTLSRATAANRRPRAASIILALVGLGLAAGMSAESPIQFTDITAQSGITFEHKDGSSGQYYLIETMSAGVALFDYNNDGFIDVYFPNGRALQGCEYPVPPLPALYRNNGDGTFTDVTVAAGLATSCYGLGVAVADYDNDGNPDLYLSNFGANILYRNNGDGTFTDVTAQTGTGDDPSHAGAGVCFLDIDGDGWLDLFSGHYVQFTYAGHIVQKIGSAPGYAGPLIYPLSKNVLFHNQGDGTFADVTEKSGLGAHPGSGMGVTACDYDQNGVTDIFVANDVGPNFLFQNDGRGHFEEIGLAAGIALNYYGREQGNMGMEFGDYDNDGWLDLYVTAYHNQYPLLFHNLGNGLFEDVTRITGAGAGTLPKVKWGEGFVDLDNDGHRDLFVICGGLQIKGQIQDDRYADAQRHTVLWNNGQGKFLDLTAQTGPALQQPSRGRGAGFDDLDNDGDVDVVILNARGCPTVLRNDSSPRRHWLQVELRGVKTNRDGVGARVKVNAGDLLLVDEVHSGRAYQSHYGTRLYFGLGDNRRVDRLEVCWSGGGTNVFTNIAADQRVRLTEGRSQPD